MNRNKLNFTYGTCVTIEVVIASVIAILTALGQHSIISLLFSLSFIVTFVFVALKVFEQNKVNISIVLAVLCVINVTLNGLQEYGRMNFDYYKKVIMFCCFMFLVYYSIQETEEVPAWFIQIIEILPVVAGSFLVFSYYYMGNTEEIAEGITLGFANPNFTGMWLLHFFLYGALFVLKAFKGGSKLRLLYIPVLLIIYNLIPETGARSCQIGALAFFAFMLLKPLMTRSPSLFAVCIAIFPFLFAIFYLTFVDQPWFQNAFSFMISEGKNLTSRVRIWTRAFNGFTEHPIFGNYSGISYGTGQSQMHNTHIDVLASYGILGFVLFIKILFDRLKQSNKAATSFYQTSAFCAFCAVIVSGTFEAAMVSGAMGLNLLTVGLLLLAQNEASKATSQKGIRVVWKKL